MKYLSVEDFKDFECVGDKCLITCCGGGWGIIIDKNSKAYYDSVQGEFGEKLHESIVEKQGQYYFKEEQGTCCLLDEKGLCEVYKTLGAENMCDVCKTYPRFQYQVGDVFWGYMTTSCPEITRRIIQRKNLMQVDLADVGSTGQEKEDTDWEFFNHSIRAYTAGMNILQNRDLRVHERLAVLMIFVKQFEDGIRSEKNLSDIIMLFSNKDIYHGILKRITFLKGDFRYKLGNFIDVVKYMLHASCKYPIWETISQLSGKIAQIPDFGEKYVQKEAELRNTEDMQNELEQLMAYKFFCVFMQGFEKKNFYELLVTECMFISAFLSFAVIMEIVMERCSSQAERIMFYSLCSRIGHNEALAEIFKTQLKEKGMDELNNLFRLIG